MRCPKCGSGNIYETLVYFNVPQMDNKKMCYDCGYEWGNKPSGWDNYTVFHQITASPEVLAEDLVYEIGAMWMSTLITDTTFDTYEEAIAATVARLKEVEK